MKLFILAIMSFSILANTKVLMKTNKGEIELELFDEKAPITVKNFKDYIKSGFYKDTIFHRVIDGFMIQGGGFDSNLNEKKTNAAIKNEASNNVSNEIGTIAMARTQVVDSATSQFFINVGDNKFLDYTSSNPGYAVFGKVTRGMSVVNVIKKVQTKSNGPFQNLPVENIKIESIEIKK